MKDANEAKHVGNAFVESNNHCSSLVVSEGTEINNDNYFFKIHNFFVFVPSIQVLINDADKLSSNSLWEVTTKTYFVITSEISDIETLIPVLLEIWSKKIINFVVVVVSTKYQVYTYNAYKQKSHIRIPKSNKFCENHFPDKLKDLQGKHFRASITENAPYTPKKNGEFTGIEIQIFKLFCYIMKASETLIEKYSVNASLQAVINDEVDIFLTRVFQVHYFINVEYSYPYDMVSKIVMVPKPSKIPPYMNLFLIFDISTWLWLLGIIIMLPIVFIASEKHPTMRKYQYYCLHLWSILLNVSSNTFKTKMKWLFFVWVWSTIILNAAFQSALLGSYLKPSFERGVKNLDDLRASELKFNLHFYFATSKELLELLRLPDDRYVRTELVDTRKLIWKRDTSYAYLVSSDFADYFLNLLKKQNGDPTYEVIQDLNLVPGVLVFHLQRHSPFLKKFDRSLLLFKQFGLLRNEIYQNAKISTGEEVLNISHFLAVFCLLAIGLSSGLLILVGEIFWHKYKGNRPVKVEDLDLGVFKYNN
ncbi:hypothetical protein JTB14_022506 [Gonioctena quinquepunctata]|nr:hypothetical protein JTB14_022506 [Gonioctena quinquepunctata]